MSNNPIPSDQGTNILRTNKARMIWRWVWRCLNIGVLVGLVAMLLLNFGIVGKVINLFSKEPTEVVAHVASNEMKEADLNVTGNKIDLSGVKFGPYTATYNGEEHVLEINGKLPEGVNVTYRNNKHTNAGTYVAEAIFTKDGCEPAVMTANMVIKKAKITGVEIHDRIVEYDPNGMYSIELVGKENIPAGASVSYYPPAGVKEPGIYNAKAVIYVEDGNYETLVLEGTLTIIDLKSLVSFEKDSYSFVYDGKAHNVELVTSEIPDEIKDAIDFKVEHKYVKDGETFGEIVDAGTYTVIANVSAKGFNSFSVCNATVTVTPGDLVELYGTAIEGGTYEYNKTAHKVKITGNQPKSVEVKVEYYLNGSKVESAIVPGTYTVKVTFTDTKGNVKGTTLECEIIVNKIDISGCLTFENVEEEYAVDKDKNPVGYFAVVDIDEAALAAKGVEAGVLKILYYYGDNNGSNVPPAFYNVGEYAVKAVVTLSGNVEYFEDVELEATVKITPAYKSTINGVSAKGQLVVANGKYITPKITAPEGAVVEHRVTGMYIGWLKSSETDVVVPGVKYVNYYFIETTFTVGNYYTTRNTSIIVLPNFAIVAVFAIVATLIGLGIALVIIYRNKDKEEDSDIKFQRPSEAVAKARGKIVCESRAVSKNSGVEGRLYLTEKTVEFYSHTLTKSDDNILIALRNVRNIDVTAHNVINIRANNEDYIFEVPGCVAIDWKHEMVNVEEAKRAIATKANNETYVAQPQVTATAPVEEIKTEEVKVEEPTTEENTEI